MESILNLVHNVQDGHIIEALLDLTSNHFYKFGVKRGYLKKCIVVKSSDLCETSQ